MRIKKITLPKENKRDGTRLDGRTEFANLQDLNYIGLKRSTHIVYNIIDKKYELVNYIPKSTNILLEFTQYKLIIELYNKINISNSINVYDFLESCSDEIISLLFYTNLEDELGVLNLNSLHELFKTDLINQNCTQLLSKINQ